MSRPASGGNDSRLSAPDRALYALFARHADERRHAADRKRYRGVNLRVSFDVYLARAYGLSWVVCLLVLVGVLLFVAALPPRLLAVPGLPQLPQLWVAAFVSGVVATGAKHATVRAAGTYLQSRVVARRSRIRQSLPGVARYLHALASGSDGPRAMLRRVAESDAYGETGREIRTALNTAELTGSLDAGLGRVARDTPSREAFAPFLLKFREHASQGEDALANYLQLESRMLGHRRERAHERNADLMELLAELFVVLLVLPALLVIILTVMSVLAPDLSRPIQTPLGTTTKRAILTYGAAGFVVCVGGVAAAAVESLRPTDQQIEYQLPSRPLAVLASAGTNPTSASVVWTVPTLAIAVVLWNSGLRPANVVLLGYTAFALPVGIVALRRARRDDAKDREIKDFVHAVSGHVSLGRPLPRAVELVARDVDLGPLNPDVDDLAFNLNHTGRAGEDLRTAALDRFVERVGTPLSARTVGLVTGALDAGSNAEAVFETLQTEVGRLYHEKRALRSNMLVYVAIGWTTALLVVGIVIAVSTQVIDSFTQLSALSGADGFALDPGAVNPERARWRFYLVTQATVLASGWFAGAADRGPYAMLLHSGALVFLTFVAFAAGGVV
jgi:archaellum biogenesis protein FlaJ (TadC family)